MLTGVGPGYPALGSGCLGHTGQIPWSYLEIAGCSDQRVKRGNLTQPPAGSYETGEADPFFEEVTSVIMSMVIWICMRKGS